MNVKEQSDTLRKDVAKRLEKIIEHYDLSPRLLEPLLDIGYRSIYRWMGSEKGMWIPTLEQCDTIIQFLKETQKIEADIKDEIVGFNGSKSEVTLAALYQHDMLKVLKDSDLEIEKKIQKLIKLAIRKWSWALK